MLNITEKSTENNLELGEINHLGRPKII